MADGYERWPASGLGTLVRARRLAAGLSQQELADLAEISVGTLRDLEQGRTRRPRAQLTDRLAGILGLDPAQARLLSTGRDAGDAGRDRPDLRRDGLWLRILGPLAGWRDGRPLPLGQPRQLAVLGLLAVGAGRGVHRGELVDGVWGHQPPATAVNLVQAYVGRLRQVLDAGRSPRDPAGVLVSTGQSYRLQLTADTLDWLRFRELAGQAGAACARGDLLGGCRHYAEALALWQGEPLADIDCLRDGPAVAVLRRAWAAAVTDYAYAALTAGVPERVLPYLWALAERDPLNERAHALLMRALAAGGQRADALRVFTDVRERLDLQLGIRPGAELAEAHVRILHPDGAVADGTVWAEGVARQLPAAVPGFVGRGEELDALTAVLDGTDTAAGGTVVISAIGGTAGIGKTALAVHWAHCVADRFPDGQLYVDLRGFDPAGLALGTAEVVRGFLDALRVPAQRMPMGVEAQVALYRSLLADRRVLVVLDNAYDSAQVRPLLPDSPTCLVVVTSRRRLSSLMVTEGARLINVELLNHADARLMLAERLGAARVAAEPEAVDELVQLCAGLPLALAIAAARAAAHPEFPIATLLGQVRDVRLQLDTLSGGDPASDLRTVFSCSYQHLSTTAARLFRLLGLHPGPDISMPVAASLAGISRAQARRALDELSGAYLVAERVPGRYVLHDLLRTYAGELVRQEDSDAERRAAIDRAFSHYLHSLDEVDRLRYATSKPILSLPLLPDVVPEEFTDPDLALAWCQAERPVLAAMILQAAEAGPQAYSTGNAWCVWLYFHLWSHWHDLPDARRVVLTATRVVEPGETPGALAAAPGAYGPYGDARDRYRQLVELGQQRGERTASAYCLFGLTQILSRLGRPHEAQVFAEYALDWLRVIGDKAGTALALDQIGRYQIRLGRHVQAVAYCRQALDLCRTLADRIGEASASDSLGLAYHYLSEHREAVGWCERAAVLYGELGDRNGQAEALIHLGDAQHAAGDDEAAGESWRGALALIEEPNHPYAARLRDNLRRLAAGPAA